MLEELDFCIESAEEQMANVISHLEKALSKLRTGKANPQMLDGVYVDYYGTSTALSKVSNITAVDAKTIFIQPWEKSMLEPIDKAILHANIGVTPQNNGEVVIINVPPLTEERRRDIVKQAKNESEIAKVGIRNSRRDANETIKKLVKDGLPEDSGKDGEDKIQKMTDKYSRKIEEIFERKEKDLMTF